MFFQRGIHAYHQHRLGRFLFAYRLNHLPDRRYFRRAHRQVRLWPPGRAEAVPGAECRVPGAGAGCRCCVPAAGAGMEKWLPPSRVGLRRPRVARGTPSMPSSSPYCSLLLYRENRELPGELPLVAELDDESERMHAKQFHLTVIITDTHFPLITPNSSHPNPAYHQPVHLLPCSGIFRNAVAATSSSPSHRPGVALRERHVRQCSYIEPVRWREEESSEAVRPQVAGGVRRRGRRALGLRETICVE